MAKAKVPLAAVGVAQIGVCPVWLVECRDASEPCAYLLWVACWFLIVLSAAVASFDRREM
jgi:hypothetical protein